GYGRRELCPGSDLDLVLVHAGRRDIAEVADRIWYPIWDSGVRLDHSVRTVKEALDVAETDLKVMLGLQTARLVAGDAALATRLRDEANDRWRNGARKWLAVLRDHVAARHERFGEVAFLLEPDVKEGRGGLRDVHAVALARAASPVVAEPTAGVGAAYDILLTVRVELHRRTGRADDRLLLELQDDVAAALQLDADQLMGRVAEAARTIAWYGDDSWRRVSSWLEGPKGRRGGTDQALGDGLVVRDGEIALTAEAVVDAATALRAGAASARTGAPIARAALARLVDEVPAPEDPWPDATRDGLVALLSAGRPAVAVLETLDQHGLLARLLPEWLAVRSKPQRNAYHRFTVDRHLCEAAANAAALADTVDRPDLLVVGALLHDIGKGFPGDHTVVGMEKVDRIGTRMGFTADDVGLLVGMVEHHLLLPHVATRRDLSDPRTAESVAEAVKRRDLLQLLGALTEADSLATGPSAWSDWKAGLVRELVDRAGALLEGARVPEPEPLVRDEHRAVMGGHGVTVNVEGDRVTVVAPDRPGLFARVAGVLALHGLDVRGASAGGEGGMAVEVFEVDAPFGDPDWGSVEADLTRAIDGPFALQARLSERDRTYAPGRRAMAAVPATPGIEWDNEASASASVLEVRTLDRIGVLYRITRALADCDLDVRSARVSTLGDEVVDAFYVVDGTGAKISEPVARAEVERAVRAALDAP
ncbi:MAG: [protein-PII] uridylyltransferase, partial [Actinobacteria bacterium]|nr:[protein-PII] uridylyltransferase [Actinomycetota bacterium]